MYLPKKVVLDRLEQSLREPKSLVLPLHHRTKNLATLANSEGKHYKTFRTLKSKRIIRFSRTR